MFFTFRDHGATVVTPLIALCFYQVSRAGHYSFRTLHLVEMVMLLSISHSIHLEESINIAQAQHSDDPYQERTADRLPDTLDIPTDEEETFLGLSDAGWSIAGSIGGLIFAALGVRALCLCHLEGQHHHQHHAIWRYFCSRKQSGGSAVEEPNHAIAA